MNITQDTLLLTSASGEALLIVGIAFAISALVLFALALEAGTYPRLADALKRLRDKIRHNRHNDRHDGPTAGMFGGGDHHALPQG